MDSLYSSIYSLFSNYIYFINFEGYFLLKWSCFLVIFLPLVLIILNAFFIKSLSIPIFLTTGIFLLMLCSVIINCILFNFNILFFFECFNIIFFEFFQLDCIFIFDFLNSIMCSVVSIISCFVHLFAIFYMNNDEFINLFMFYLTLFTIFMLILILSDNFVLLFVGWEGVGLCSFLLISFWSSRLDAVKSALKAIFLNRIGDFCILISIFFLYLGLNHLDFFVLFSLFSYIYTFFICYIFDYFEIICFFLFLGAVGKSAQLGLHTWLPDAMEGPTPVSALIHAATMVTAGVFLIIRCSYFFENVPDILLIITFLGSLTAFFGATIGLVQVDLKKIIAFSTCSQLGYMIFTCGISNYDIALFHLFNHAFFKALLFLGAGVIIHTLSDEQDIRQMGNLELYMPYVYLLFLIGSFSLIGFPLFSGYFSKDFIIELIYFKWNNLFDSFSLSFFYNYIYNIAIISAFFTAFYSWRLLFFVFFYSFKGSIYVRTFIVDSFYILLFILICLGFFSIFSGFFFFFFFSISFYKLLSFWSFNVYGLYLILLETLFFFDLNMYFLKLNSLVFFDFQFNFQGSIYLLSTHFLNFIELHESLPFLVKYLPSFFGIISIFLIFLFAFYIIFVVFLLNKLLFHLYFYNIYLFLFKKWYFDIIYNNIVYKCLHYFYNIYYSMLDKGFLDFVSYTCIVNGIYSISKNISYFHSPTIFIEYFRFMLFLVFFFFLFICDYFFIF